MNLSRRRFIGGTVAAGLLARSALSAAPAKAAPVFQLRYTLASCLYGTMPLAQILPEVAKTGADAVDIWPRIHGNQREQMEEMGHDAFAALLAKQRVRLGILTRYDLGPFKLKEEMAVAKKLGCAMIVAGAGGKNGLTGDALKTAVREFAEALKPVLALAEQSGVTLAIENHSGQLLHSPDGVRWLVEAVASPRLGIALAPYHLPQQPAELARLIKDLGPRLAHFYAWEYGSGCMVKMPKTEELQQLPGRGRLDFAPLMGALRAIKYRGGVSVFMHPVPRGVPILETAAHVTTEVNRARKYLEDCLAKS